MAIWHHVQLYYIESMYSIVEKTDLFIFVERKTKKRYQRPVSNFYKGCIDILKQYCYTRCRGRGNKKIVIDSKQLLEYLDIRFQTISFMKNTEVLYDGGTMESVVPNTGSKTIQKTQILKYFQELLTYWTAATHNFIEQRRK